MENIIVELKIPATNNTCDFIVPVDIPLRESVEGIKSVLEKLEQNIVFADAETLICDIDNARMLDQNLSPSQLGMKDSMRLMII